MKQPQVKVEAWDAPGQKPLIRFENVTKRFGDFVALDNLSLEIFPREFFALLGPSGSGKTTLMRLLGGFEKPSEGRIWIDGVDVTDIPPNRRAVNMMFQSYALFPHLNVYDNIAFGLRWEKRSKSDIDVRVKEMLELVRLEKFATRKPHQLSGGQRQRVALARALAKAPKLLLLDEPLGALDKKLRQDTQFQLVDIQEKTGTTFVIVTHDQEEAMTVATRIAVMSDGLVQQVDTPAQIYEAPANTYVADFIGEANFIKGQVIAHENEMAMVNWQDANVEITGLGTTVPVGGNATMMVRPEKINIAKDKPAQARNMIDGIVEDIGYLGNVSTYRVRLSTGEIIKAQSPNQRRIASREITWQDHVWLSWSDRAGVVLGE